MKPEELPVAILAGGLATRLKPITEKIPKLLVEVAGEPFFTHQIRLLRKSGLRRLVVCVGYLGERIVERYGDGSRWDVSIKYSFDGPRLLGTGGALIKALPMLSGRSTSSTATATCRSTTPPSAAHSSTREGSA